MMHVKLHLCKCCYSFGRIKIIIYQRYVLIVLLLIGGMNLYGMRHSFSDVAVYIIPGKNSSYEAYAEPRITWNSKQRSYIKYCFYFGYLLAHIPSGMVCDVLGGRSIVMIGFISGAILSLIQPTIILLYPWWVMCIGNFISGSAQGMTMPALYNLMSHWLPHSMITAGSAIAYSGGTLGNLLNQIYARHCVIHLKTWPWVFYIWGITSLVWTVLFAFYVFSTPESHPFVSDKELQEMRSEMGTTLPNKIPLKSILTDSGTWALLIGQFGHDWTLFIGVTSIQTYIRGTLKIDVSNYNTVLYIKHISYWASTCTCGLLANYFIKKEYLPTENIRAIFAFVGIVGPSIISLILTYAGDDPNTIISLSILVLFTKGPINAGLKANVFDITRHYVGTIAAITNGIGSVTSILSTIVVRNMAPDDTMQQWRKVTWMSFAICCYSYLVFFIWIKGQTAHWDYEEKITQNVRLTVLRSKTESF